MKKLITIWAAALVVLAPLCAKSAKEAHKQAKAAERTLKKDGFKPYELGSVTVNLENYFQKVDAGCTPILGTSGPCITENLAKMTALANAANEYALMQGGDVRGRLISVGTNLSGQQMDNLIASFERLINKNIRGELIPYASFYRERGGMYQVRVYCIIDEDAAARARRHALERALKSRPWLRSTVRWSLTGSAKASSKRQTRQNENCWGFHSVGVGHLPCFGPGLGAHQGR